MDVYLKGKRIRLTPNMLVGQGGEADIYNIGNGQVLKVYKPPTHPDFAGMPELQKAASARLNEHQKKLRQFPRGLPDTVITPQELVTDKTGATIVGYTMRFIDQAEVLARLNERSFRSQVPSQITKERVIDLHHTVSKVHKLGVVIADFNDLNALMKGDKVYLVDADSMQFGPYFSLLYTEKFVDPLLCDANAVRPILITPHNTDSDWYAYAVMLMEAFLMVDPYGGVYRPKGKPTIVHTSRPLKRITVF